MTPAALTTHVAGGAAAIDAGLRAAFDGARFLVYLRNRAVGEEEVRLRPGPGGGAVLEALTRIAIGSFRLEQRVVAEVAADLRPRGCRITASQPSPDMTVEIAVESAQARVRHAAAGRVGERTVPLTAAPLLLVDNCFALHALAALAALRAAPATDRWLALPAEREVSSLSPGAGEVRAGGTLYPRPEVTLLLADGLEEQAWVVEGRVDRLMVPALRMRAERAPASSRPEGGLA